MKIWIVDAFTDTAFKGNPAGVLLVKEFPKDEICQQIAAELNLPETGFVKPLSPDNYQIRWFTPILEVDICGHGTLAAAHVLFEEKHILGAKVTFESLAGPLIVSQEEEGLVMDFPLLEVENKPFDSKVLVELFDFKSLKKTVFSHNAVLAEFDDEEELRNLNLDPEKVKQLDCNGLIITAKAVPPYDFVSRVFGPKMGVNEDPVTGSVHCLLAEYWQKKLKKDEFLAYQASPRGGELGIKIVNDRVYLKGKAVTILEGKWMAS
jgi:PhzF family phenazine biosynthesis protein